MEFYFDIKIFPNPEIKYHEIMGKLMEKLHLFFMGYEGRVGISFPKYQFPITLGNIVRIFGNRLDLNALNHQVHQIDIFYNYTLITDIRNVPRNIKVFASYKRKHASRGEKNSRVPNVKIKSSSNKNEFLLFILENTKLEKFNGKFNSYGLSEESATVPLF